MASLTGSIVAAVAMKKVKVQADRNIVVVFVVVFCCVILRSVGGGSYK